MKTLLYFSLLVLLVGVAGCKKDAYCFEGNYHMVGYSENWNVDTVYPKLPIDTLLTVMEINNSTFYFCGKSLKLWEDLCGCYVDRGYVYTWQQDTSNYSVLNFHKPFNDDSAFCHLSSGESGKGTNIYLSGIKIH